MENANTNRLTNDDLNLGTFYTDGEIIFCEGEQCDALYVVQSGKVRTVSVQPSGREVEISVAGPGEVFGITSFFDNSRRSASAVAIGQASVLKLDRAKIMKAVHNDPSLVFFILRTISHRTRKLKRDLVRSESRYQR